jgi:glycosyltransferase involved in cell wall biosynthesis
MPKIKIAHVTQSVSRLAGGLFESVRYLSQVVNSLSNSNLAVLGIRDEMAAEDTACWSPIPVHTYPYYGPQKLGFAPGMLRALRDMDPELVHLHGLWRYTSVVVWRWAMATGRPYMVSPHGMLEPWSLGQSRVKKRLASLLYQGPCLRGATCIRATSRMEAESIRLAGYQTPIALVPNGVVVPPAPLPRTPRENGRIRRALFLSRIHPKKGLINLVKAWHTLKPAGWELVIAGPDEGGHLAEVRAAVREHGLEAQISFPGEVMGDDKLRLYCDSDLFVLPSFSENFGLVIAEALSCEVPVITTRATPWHELEERQCGWWIDTGVEPLVAALKEAFAHEPSTLQAMGVRGRRLIEQNYTWEPIGLEIIKVYEWMLGRGPKPDCIIDGPLKPSHF